MFRAQSTKDKVILYKKDNKKEKLLVSVGISGNHEIPHKLIQEVSQFIRYLKLDDYVNAISDDSDNDTTTEVKKKPSRKKK